MKTLLGLALLISSTTAFAQPTPSFSKTTSFESCHKSTMFACGMRDAQGNTFGTAKEMTRCEKYVFAPNGTYAVQGKDDRGTYRVIGKTVRLTPLQDGKPGASFDLVLSADGAKLGDMKLVR
jgi:hypothetical protein